MRLGYKLAYRLLPKVEPFLKLRTSLKERAKGFTVRETLERYGDVQRIHPWAFIRVKDEISTIRASLESILPCIDRGVIAYNQCTDGTDDFIHDFCHEHPGFLPFAFPYDVIPAKDRRYAENPPYHNTLACYYNTVLALIPDDAWFVKIDCDMVYEADIFRKAFTLELRDDDFVSFSRLDLAKDNRGELRVISYVRPDDHFLLKKRPDIHFKNVFGYVEGRFVSYEVLVRNCTRTFRPECSALHFPYEKAWRPQSSKIHLEDLEPALLRIPEEELNRTVYTPERIREVSNRFESGLAPRRDA